MLREIAETRVNVIAKREPVRVRAETGLIEVVTAMKEAGRGAAFVEDESGKLIGVFTERDLVAKLDHASHAWHRTPVGEVMIRDPISIEESQIVRNALAVMVSRRFRRLPIVDADGRAVAMLSIRDILALVASYFPKELLNLPPDPDQEPPELWGG